MFFSAAAFACCCQRGGSLIIHVKAAAAMQCGGEVREKSCRCWTRLILGLVVQVHVQAVAGAAVRVRAISEIAGGGGREK